MRWAEKRKVGNFNLQSAPPQKEVLNILSIFYFFAFMGASIFFD